jgi:hypothetical protein
MILPHLTSTVFLCHATPHTPRGVVVWQLQRPTCPTSAEPQVWQVWQPDDTRAAARRKGAGTWCLKSAPSASTLSGAVAGRCRCRGFAESLDAAPDSLAALERIHGLPTPHRLHPSSHSLPTLTLAPLSEQISESQQAGHGYRPAVMGTDGRVERKHGAVGRRRERARSVAAGRQSLAIASPRPGEGKTEFAAPAPSFPARHSALLSAGTIRFFMKTIRENRSAAVMSLEINRGRDE